MLLVLLGVLLLHLIILILLIVSTAASVSSTFSLFFTFWLFWRQMCARVERTVLLCQPDLDCRWRNEQRSVVQMPDSKRRLPLQTGQQWRFGSVRPTNLIFRTFRHVNSCSVFVSQTGSRRFRPSWSCRCSSASSPSLPSCTSCSGWSRADASSSRPSSRSWPVSITHPLSEQTITSHAPPHLSDLSPGVFVMCAAIIYTVMSPDEGSGVQFGYAYVLAWVAFPLCLISGLIYIVLRKKEWERERRAEEEEGCVRRPPEQHSSVPTAHRPETDIITAQQNCTCR